MITHDGKVWSFNGMWGDIDPYNLLHLPPFTAQLRYTDGITPTFIEGATAVQVSESPNLWNVTYENTNWDLFLYSSTPAELLEIRGMNSKGVTSMYCMCQGCGKLTYVANFDTSAVTNMSWMFNACMHLPAVPLFDTRNVTTMESMFENCLRLRTVPLFNTSKVTNMRWMFGMSNMNTDAMIDGCPLFDTSNVTTMEGMFFLTKVPSIPAFNTSKVTNMADAFRETPITSLPMLDTSNVTSMSRIVLRCVNLTAIPNWDTSKVTDWLSAFQNTPSMLTLPTHLDYSSAVNVKEIAAYNPTKTGGITDLYNKLSAVPTISNHVGAFYQCGTDTTTGAAELAQIPDDWKGDPE